MGAAGALLGTTLGRCGGGETEPLTVAPTRPLARTLLPLPPLPPLPPAPPTPPAPGTAPLAPTPPFSGLLGAVAGAVCSSGVAAASAGIWSSAQSEAIRGN